MKNHARQRHHLFLAPSPAPAPATESARAAEGSPECAPRANRSRSRPEIKLRQLRYFLAGAEHLHFSKAAESQCVTQSTLSHQIAELEGQIGQLLFDRSTKTVRLTQAGEVFRAYARRIVGEVDAGCSALFELDAMVHGTLRVGATQSFVHRCLGSALGEFLAQHPAVHLHVEELTAPQIEQQLHAGQLDLGIAFAPTTRDDLTAEVLMEEDMVLVAGHDHRLAGYASLRMSQLSGEPLALLTGEHLSRRHIDGCFRDAGIAARVACDSNNLALILDLVRSSGIAAIVPSGMVDGRVDLHAARLTDPAPRRSVALLRSPSRQPSEAAGALAAILRSRFKPPQRTVRKMALATA